MVPAFQTWAPRPSQRKRRQERVPIEALTAAKEEARRGGRKTPGKMGIVPHVLTRKEGASKCLPSSALARDPVRSGIYDPGLLRTGMVISEPWYCVNQRQDLEWGRGFIGFSSERLWRLEEQGAPQTLGAISRVKTPPGRKCSL